LDAAVVRPVPFRISFFAELREDLPDAAARRSRALHAGSQVVVELRRRPNR